jgi:hypothetical protein
MHSAQVAASAEVHALQPAAQAEQTLVSAFCQKPSTHSVHVAASALVHVLQFSEQSMQTPGSWVSSHHFIIAHAGEQGAA